MADNPSIADISPGGVLPSERARATEVATRMTMLRFFAVKVGMAVESELPQDDGSIVLILRPTS